MTSTFADNFSTLKPQALKAPDTNASFQSDLAIGTAKMVQHGAYTYDFKGRAKFLDPSVDYWKLKNYADLDKVTESTHDLYTKFLRKRLRNPTKLYSKRAPLRLRQLAVRSERGLLIYDPFSEDELRAFVASRHLDPVTKRTKGCSEKTELIARLEKADEDVTFRLGDLPAELRAAVYEFHIQSLDREEVAQTQPPITKVSRLVRQETLPIFYNTFPRHLYISFFCNPNAMRTIGWPGSINDPTDLSANIAAAALFSTKRLQIHVYVNYPHWAPPLDDLPYIIDVEFSVSNGGVLCAMPSLDRKRSRHSRAWSALTPAEKLRQNAPSKVDEALRMWHRDLVLRRLSYAEKLVAAGEESSLDGPSMGLMINGDDLEKLKSIY